MFGPAKQQHAQAIIQVLADMRRHGLTLDDLIALGGEDQHASNPTRKEKACRAEKTWALMTRLGLKYTDLENSPTKQPSTTPTRTRRGEGHFLQVTEIAEVSGTALAGQNPMKSMT